MKNSLFLLVLLIILGSCNNDKKNDYATGSVVMATDPSFYNVADALSYRYMKVYPEAKIELKQMKEKEALKALIDNKVSTIVMSRELTETEKQSFLSNIKLKAVPAYFAADALVFVVPKESSIEKISVDDVAKMLTDEKRTLIFDGANTSNTDYIAERLKIDPAKMQYSSLKSNEEIIENLTKFPGHIGVISLNTISFGENVDKLLLADTLAMQSGGIYQNICNSEQLKMVFKDIYFRTKNHYIIEYSTSNYPSTHSVKIKLCDKSLKKSIKIQVCRRLYFAAWLRAMNYVNCG